MSASLTRIYRPASFEKGQVEAAFKKIPVALGIQENMCSLKAHLNHPSGIRESKNLGWKDLAAITEINHKDISCVLLSYHPIGDDSSIIYIEARYHGDLFIHCETPNIHKTNNLVGILEQDLGLEVEADGETTTGTNDEEYIDRSRLQELRNIPPVQFDLSRLIRILEELNVSYKNHSYISVITLTRALLDHVPPIFSLRTFSEVANNYTGSKSFKESLKHLEESSRKIADQYLHTQIRRKESLPNRTQVNFSNDIDVLLGEIVRILK